MSDFGIDNDAAAVAWLRAHGFRAQLFAEGWIVAWPDHHTFTRCVPGHVSDFVRCVVRGEQNLNRYLVGEDGNLTEYATAGVGEDTN